MHIKVFSLTRNWKTFLFLFLLFFNLFLLYYYMYSFTSNVGDVYKKVSVDLNELIIPGTLLSTTPKEKNLNTNYEKKSISSNESFNALSADALSEKGLQIDKPGHQELVTTHTADLGQKNVTRSFTVDYHHDRFLKDEKPFQILSGSMHYFRIPRKYWRDRLRKLKAAGFNTVSFYIEWSSHEPDLGNYKFTGELNFEHFIQLAVEEQLLVIVRPGPYICGERDAGGFPSWLLTRYPFMMYRTSDIDFKEEVGKWFSLLMPKISKYLYGNGGPVIMVALENEYGSRLICDPSYKMWMRDLVEYYVRGKAVLFTVDVAEDFEMRCGSMPEVLAAYDFGAWHNMEGNFRKIRGHRMKGPIFCSEFWGGWPTHWAEPRVQVMGEQVKMALHYMLSRGASVNFYMFHGGTNFGFKNGANILNNIYQPIMTSYDYHAMLNEAGDPTEKYFLVRDVLSQYVSLQETRLPKPYPKGSYGKVVMRPVASLLRGGIPNAGTVYSLLPKSFEEMDARYGYLLYETMIPPHIIISGMPCSFNADGLRDRGHLFINEQLVTTLNRNMRTSTTLFLNAFQEQKLALLVENQGRIHIGPEERKGLLWAPFLNFNSLMSWSITRYPLDNVAWVENFTSLEDTVSPPAFYVGHLVLPPNTKPLDTFVDMTGWGKGVIFINNKNLGRYWPSVGPQVTLYVPGCYLRPAPESNVIVLFETDFAPEDMKISFGTKHIIDKFPLPFSHMS